MMDHRHWRGPGLEPSSRTGESNSLAHGEDIPGHPDTAGHYCADVKILSLKLHLIHQEHEKRSSSTAAFLYYCRGISHFKYLGAEKQIDTK